jgi:hypothetical protein
VANKTSYRVRTRRQNKCREQTTIKNENKSKLNIDITSCIENASSIEKMPIMSKNLHMASAAMTNLAEGLCLNALLMLKVEKCIISLWAHEYRHCP